MSELGKFSVVSTIQIKGDPPKTTAQQKKVAIVNGRPRMYAPKRLKMARSYLVGNLRHLRPKSPLKGVLGLHVRWCFKNPKGKKGERYKITRPDTDNLQKLLKDCMTECGFWEDDAQVAFEVAEKLYSDEPRLEICIMAEREEHERKTKGVPKA